MISQNTPNQLNRRKWLRDAAIAATSVTVVPSFFIGCTDHPMNPGSGLVGAGSAPPIIEGELERAAQNIQNMILWLDHLHSQKNDYETEVFTALQSGQNGPPGWSDFIINVVLDILIGAVTAGAAFIEGATAGVLGAGIVAGLAVASELIKKFAFPESRPNTLNGTFSDFKTAQDNLYTAVRDTLNILADETKNEPLPYKNLRDRWKQEIDFNGKKRPISDLAKADFPKTGQAYVDLTNGAMAQFRKYYWNVMFIKAGELVIEDLKFVHYDSPGHHATSHAIQRYKDYPGDYIRGYYSPPNIFGEQDGFYFKRYYYKFDGKELSKSAAEKVFQDSVPGRWITPDDKGNPTTGLFPRDYVFKQLVREKTPFQFSGSFGRSYFYYQIRNDFELGSCKKTDACAYLDANEPEYKFTGGLIK